MSHKHSIGHWSRKLVIVGQLPQKNLLTKFCYVIIHGWKCPPQTILMRRQIVQWQVLEICRTCCNCNYSEAYAAKHWGGGTSMKGTPYMSYWFGGYWGQIVKSCVHRALVPGHNQPGSLCITICLQTACNLNSSNWNKQLSRKTCLQSLLI